MFDFTRFSDTVEVTVAVTGLITALGGAWLRWGLPRWQAFRAKTTAALDSLVGRPAVVDSITGVERVPALPGIGVRMDHAERQMELLTTTVAKLADQEAAITELREVAAQHAKDIALLQAGVVERVANKVEQTELFKTMQRMQDEDPTLDGEALDDEGDQQ